MSEKAGRSAKNGTVISVSHNISYIKVLFRCSNRNRHGVLCILEIIKRHISVTKVLHSNVSVLSPNKLLNSCILEEIMSGELYLPGVNGYTDK